MMRQPTTRRLLWQALATVTPLFTGRAVVAGVSEITGTTSRMMITTTTTNPRNRSIATIKSWGGLSAHQQQQRALSVRGGDGSASSTPPPTTAYETLADPAPGSPFHYAFPVHDLELAKDFYGRILGCVEGRSCDKLWQDYSLHGHQIVAHRVGHDYRCIDYYNPVDGDEVPVPHTGLALTVDQFHELAARVKAAGIPFVIEPHLRFPNMPGEQYTMFFKDPSGNNLEFKAMTKPENLFAKYNV